MLNIIDFTKKLFEGSKPPKIKPTVAINSREDLTDALAELQKHKAALLQVLANYNKAIAEASTLYCPTGQALQIAIMQMEESIIAYCEPRKTELLKGCEGKTVDLGVGKISWYLTAERLTATPDDYTAIEELRSKKLERYVVIETTLSKNAIKADWNAHKLGDKLTHLRLTGGNEKIKIETVGIEE